MSLFGKSFEEKVQEAIGRVKAQVSGVSILRATVDGKIVTLEGEAANMAAKQALMAAFNAMVETDNTINKVAIPHAPEAAPPAAAASAAPGFAATDTLYEVRKGDTLSAIAKQFYGNAGKYMKIFEANTDQLTDPDKIKPGQKLRIPA